MIYRSTLAVLLAVYPVFSVHAQPGKEVSWKRIVIDKAFRSEGVGLADVNKDGKKDVISGDVWYEAPDWKMHVLAKERVVEFKDWGNVIDKGWSPIGRPGMTGYSESFAVFTDDFNADGWVDAIVIPFPGKPCYWYENPGSKGGLWKQHLLTNSACNETPIYIDLFGKRKKYLVMAWQPEGKTNEGEMCYFIPGKDPRQPWERISISGPSIPKQYEQPSTQRFSHGLGHGDVNGDGRIDIIVPQGWWEQPAAIDSKPWSFHKANLGPACADMYAFDVDGDGKNDVISSSAHLYGFWWYQQKSGMEFIQRELFQDPFKITKLSKEHGLSAEALALYNAINKIRADKGHAPWKLSKDLCMRAAAKHPAEGDPVLRIRSDKFDLERMQSPLRINIEKRSSPSHEVGVAVFEDEGKVITAVLVGDSNQFSLPSQTHALHFIDVNGDGLKDLVTGRRWWAHGPKGDAGPNDPAYIYWFEARKNKNGFTEFIPHEVDDDSGIGTAFVVEDLDGDGIPDIVRRTGDRFGAYVYGELQPWKRWLGGLRYDWSQYPVNAGDEWAIEPYLAFMPSDFLRFRLGYKHTERDRSEFFQANGGNGRVANEIFLQATFFLGAHPAHPF